MRAVDVWCAGVVLLQLALPSDLADEVGAGTFPKENEAPAVWLARAEGKLLFPEARPLLSQLLAPHPLQRLKPRDLGDADMWHLVGGMLDGSSATEGACRRFCLTVKHQMALVHEGRSHSKYTDDIEAFVLADRDDAYIENLVDRTAIL